VRRVIVLILPIIAVAACQYPRDVEGTLDRIEDGGTMRAGITDPRPPEAEARLLEDLARRLRARVRYVRGTEEELVEQLKEGELDVVVGDITKKTPWKKEVAPTRPYDEEDHVMLTRNGENAFLVRLDRHLLEAKE
jgi:polar amino acid transport system substrate-binding protein